MNRQQRREQEKQNKKTVYLTSSSNLPKRSEELNNQLVQGSERLVRAFGEIKEKLKLNEEQTWSFFQLVTTANNQFMLNPKTTLQTFISFEEIMWTAANQIKK
jgi:hypothetical protein